MQTVLALILLAMLVIAPLQTKAGQAPVLEFTSLPTGEVQLRFVIPEGQIVELQQSVDLVHWVTADTYAVGPQREARITFFPIQNAARFLRLRLP